MQYIEAVTREPILYPSLFLAGGITGCRDWQAEAAEMLKGVERLTVLNPRRADFPIDDPLAAQGQIQWEHSALRTADAILFWFPHETLCPITLFELGYWLGQDKPIFVGCHPEYKRHLDVCIQTRLVHGPDFKVDADLRSVVRRAETALSAARGGIVTLW